MSNLLSNWTDFLDKFYSVAFVVSYSLLAIAIILWPIVILVGFLKDKFKK